MTGVLGDLVGAGEPERWCRDDLGFGVETMADPAQPHRVDIAHVTGDPCAPGGTASEYARPTDGPHASPDSG